MPRHFTEEEVAGLDPRLVEMLDTARDIAGVPFVITSGFRSASHNTLVGGVENSSHEYGLAVDLKSFNGNVCWQIVTALLAAGFKRIGVYSAHVHVDIDPQRPHPVLWGGVSA